MASDPSFLFMVGIYHFSFIKKIVFFIYFWLCWVFISVWAFL